MDSAALQKAKRWKCISKEKLAGHFQKRSQRWNNLSVGKQQQVRFDAKAALESQKDALAAKQQALAADTKRLQQTSRNKFREADAAKAQAQRTTAWANNLIDKELPKQSTALALAVKMVQTGYVDMPAARRAAALKVAQDQVHPSRLSMLEKNTSVWYFHTDGRVSAATILSVHYDGGSCPYYCVKIDDESGVRNTEREKLVQL